MFKYHILLQFCIHIIENVQNISQHISCLIFKTIAFCLFVSKIDFRCELISNKLFCLEKTKKYWILSITLIFFVTNCFFPNFLKKSLYFYQLRHLRTSNFFFLQNDSHFFGNTDLLYFVVAGYKVQKYLFLHNDVSNWRNIFFTKLHLKFFFQQFLELPFRTESSRSSWSRCM